MSVNLHSLINKMNDVCRRTLEESAALCLSRTQYNVEIEHWLTKLLEVNNTDLSAILNHFEIDASRLGRDLTSALDKFQTGNSRAPALAPQVVNLAREAWLLTSLEFGEQKTRSGHLICALLSDDALRRQAIGSAPELEQISTETLSRDYHKITANSSETAETDDGQAPSDSGPARGGVGDALEKYTIDLTASARAGEIDPVLGRESEIRQIVDILTRRRQNNPILTGEAGVGKTAVAEGFALRIAAGDIPPQLQNVSLLSLDLGLLQAGAGVKGEFENRLKSVIAEVKSSPSPVILFIDEAHTLIGAGGQAGQGDAANLLKPALARGELRTLAATTWAEYKKYFERDAALARRFQVVKVEEPSEGVAIQMMQGLAGMLEGHHKVRILNEAIEASVKLSHRYIPGRQLPDKSISLLDTACARVGISRTATPPAIENARRDIRQFATAIGILEREKQSGSGGEHDERLAELAESKTQAEARLEELEARWVQEKELVTTIDKHRDQLEGVAQKEEDEEAVEDENGEKADSDAASAAGSAANGELSEPDKEKLREELSGLSEKLSELQGDEALVRVWVDDQAVSEVVSEWTGIPVGRMVTDEINAILHLQERLEERVIGQSHALNGIAQSIITSRAKMTDPRRPIGVFLLVGTSGVGKTETGMALADTLYGGDQNMTIINMTEFKEEHKVSLLMGSPPGYVGYGEGGVLTEAVRRKPYSIVLLDEMEKAHPGVQDIFYQVFDKGNLRDGEGRDIDFKNTIILMTSNAGTDLIMSLCSDPETIPEPAELAEALRPELLKHFKPAFLGRVTMIPYFPLADEALRSIIKLQFGRISRRVEENYRATFTYDEEVLLNITERCREVESGARNIDHILRGTLLPEISTEFLARMANDQPITNAHVSLDDQGGFSYRIS